MSDVIYEKFSLVEACQQFASQTGQVGLIEKEFLDGEMG